MTEEEADRVWRERVAAFAACKRKHTVVNGRCTKCGGEYFATKITLTAADMEGTLGSAGSFASFLESQSATRTQPTGDPSIPADQRGRPNGDSE